MLLTIPIDHQSNFPKEDLTEKNAEILSLLFMNRDMLRQGHMAAESMVRIYQLGHQAFKAAIDRLYDNSSTVAAFNHGITMYEAISSFVTDPPTAENEAAVILNAAGFANRISPVHFDEYTCEAADAFIYATPRTAEVVAEATREHASPHLANLAVIGAGMARKFELDNADIAT